MITEFQKLRATDLFHYSFDTAANSANEHTSSFNMNVY